MCVCLKNYFMCMISINLCTTCLNGTCKCDTVVCFSQIFSDSNFVFGFTECVHGCFGT